MSQQRTLDSTANDNFDRLFSAFAASVRKRAKFLEDCAHPKTEVIMRLLISELSGIYIDLADDSTIEMSLERIAFAEQCKVTHGLQGGSFKHRAYYDGRAYSIFDKNALGKTVQSSHFAYWWNGREIVSIQDSSGTNDPRENSIDIEALFAGEQVLAA